MARWDFSVGDQDKVERYLRRVRLTPPLESFTHRIGIEPAIGSLEPDITLNRSILRGTATNRSTDGAPRRPSGLPPPAQDAPPGLLAPALRDGAAGLPDGGRALAARPAGGGGARQQHARSVNDS
jgi:hypothetical protein